MWIDNVSESKLFAPFIVEKDNDYYDDLRKRLTYFVGVLKNSNADSKSIGIAKSFPIKHARQLGIIMVEG